MSVRRIVTAVAMVAYVVLSVGASCDTIHPAEGKGTAYPCGVWGVECIEGTCCPQNHECGGHKGLFTTCPEGYCCYTGDNWPSVGAGADAATIDPRPRPIVKQTPRTER